jgi:tetratricopeptide (TPR) repeat protein
VQGPERKLGRPPSDYPREIFAKYLREEMRRLGLSLGALARGTDMRKGDLSGILRSLRACPKSGRERLLGFVKAPAEKYTEFRCCPSTEPPEPTLVWPVIDLTTMPRYSEYDDKRPFLDASSCPHPRLHQGVRFLARGFYGEAHEEFTQIFQAAKDDRDYVLQADTATCLAWLYCDTGQFTESLKAAALSIDVIERHIVGARLRDAIHLGRDFFYVGLTPDRPAVYILCRAYYIRYRLLLDRMLSSHDSPVRHHPIYNANADFSIVAYDALRDFAPAFYGHSHRCAAVLHAARHNAKLVENLLLDCENYFDQRSLEAAYITRDRGISYWLLDRPTKARDWLEKARHDLAYFANVNGLAVALHFVSKTINTQAGDTREARRYALAAVALHPYSFIADHCQAQLKKVEHSARWREVDCLVAGKEEPYDMVHKVMARLARGSGLTGVELIAKNLARVGLMFVERGTSAPRTAVPDLIR